jgi:hypothetical protein
MTAFLAVYNRTMNDILAVRRLPRGSRKGVTTLPSRNRFVEQPTNLSIGIVDDGLQDLAGVT